MYFKKILPSTIILLSGSLLMIGCGGGGDNKPSTSNTIKGKLIDSAVEGARYVCDNGKKNTFTLKDGSFECSSLPIDFFIGQLYLGQVKTLPSDKEIHIQDIVGIDRTSTNNPKVMKIARLLQSLDNDQNPNNGIKILETKNSLFHQDINIDNFNLTQLVAIDSSIKSLVPEENVLAHLNNSTNIKHSVDKVPPIITLKGKSTVTIVQGSQYTDAGATARDNVDGTVKVVRTGQVNTSKLGTYTIIYTATDKAGNKATKKRTVKVVKKVVADTTPPVITLKGNSTVTIVQGTTYTDAGATARDNVDGTVKVVRTGQVNTSKLGTYTIIYTATDKAGNKATKKRTVKVVKKIVIDTKPPVIIIVGNNPLEVTQGETFADPGATAKDDRDGTVSVTPSGTVDMSNVGDYTITYTATDKAGNETNATRTVTVKPADVVREVSNMAEFRQALEDAAANGESDRIVLAKGTYNVTSDGLGTLKFDDNEAFDLTIEAQKGLTSKDVILDGNNSTQVFNFDNKKSSTLILKNISVVDGNTTKNGNVYTNQSIEVKDCNISNNIASSGGGFYSSGSAKVTNSIISNNSSHSSGGGFYSNGVTTVTESTISNNSNSNSRYYSYGGGFYSKGATTVTKSTISNNSNSSSRYYYPYGGGFYSNGATTVTKSTISNNNNSGNYYSYGGGFYSNGGAYHSDVVTTVTESTISNNSSRSHSTHSYGGGFYVNNGTTTVNSSNISNNSANSGGGFSSEATTTVTNSIFSESNATTGAIFYASSSYISNNIFIKNKGSISTKGIFINNIFSENDKDINLNGDSKIYNNYIDYSNIEDNGHNVIKKHNLQPASVGNIYLTSKYTLESESPVIDKGLNPSSATYKKIIGGEKKVYNYDTRKYEIKYPQYEKMLELLKTDKLGNKRVHNGTIDMGAVEYGASK